MNTHQNRPQLSATYLGVAACFLSFALTGCGGASHSGDPTASSTAGTSPTQAQARGQVSLTIKWPAVPGASSGIKPRLVPEASQSVTITLSAGGQAVGTPQTIARPSGQTTSTATFNNVPTGSITVAATAYPNADGSGTALASGSLVVQVASGTPTQASVTMGSTIDHLGITPASPSVVVGATTPLTATAYDAAGDVVLTTASKLTWASSDTSKATVDASSGVVTGVAAGTPTITVTDGESGKTGSATVSITGSGGGGGAGTTYTITDLGSLGGGQSETAAINASGEVTGDSYTSNGRRLVYLWQNGQMQNLGTTGDNSYASGINASGEVAGESEVGYVGEFALRWQNGQIYGLGELPGYSSQSTSGGINASGQIVGRSFITYGNGHAFLYQNGQMQDLGALPGDADSSATGINDSGQIVGTSSTSAGGVPHAFIYQNGQMQDLGRLPGDTGSSANAINASGQVVGYSHSGDGGYHACLWQNGQVQSLGGLPGSSYSVASAINSNGQVVGISGNDPFLWQNGQMQDLNSLIPANSGVTLTAANGINDSGQICATGTINGLNHAYLLTSVASGQARHR